VSFTQTYLDGQTVLVVGPNGERGRVVAALSALEGYSVREAGTAADAAAALDETVVCLVVVGGDVAAVAELADGTPARPVVAVVAADDAERLATVAEHGGTAVPAGALDRLGAVVRQQAESYTDHWGARQQLTAIEQLYEASRDTLFIKDDAARHLSLSDNPEIPEPEDALGATDRALHDSRFGIGEQWYEADLTVLETAEPIVERTDEYTDGDGNAFYQEVSLAPWYDEAGELRGVVGMRQEVTDEIKQQQELQRKNRRLDQFVDYITHDLQNPLQVAHGYLELARQGEDDAMAEVEQALSRMDDLIDDVEQLARGERKQTTKVGTANFVDLVEEVWAVIDSDAATLTVDAPPETVINAEIGELRPMIENLLKNALDHGPPDVTVTVGVTNDGFYVEDDGDGIPPERRDEVFEKGYTTAANGAGTGLAIVADVAESHDWTLTVSESSDGGARFTTGNCLLVTDPDQEPERGDALALTDSVDVGEPKVAGSAAFDEESETWTVTSAGADIYGDDNQFHFAYTTVEGPVRISGHVSDLEPIHGFSKAGFMVRDSLNEDAVHGYVGQTVDYGTELLWCTEPGSPTASQHVTEEYGSYEWFRIDRTGSQVTCRVSADGRVWDVIDQRSVPYEDPVHVGLAVCSVVPRNRCTAVFENVEVCRLVETGEGSERSPPPAADGQR